MREVSMTNQPKDQNTALPSLPGLQKMRNDVAYYQRLESEGKLTPSGKDTYRVLLQHMEVVNALLTHIHQQDEKIKTLEMQGKWLDIKDAPRDGTQILARGFIERLATGPCNEEYFCTAKYHKDFNRFIGPNGNEIGHAYLTHFQYINPPSPDAQPEGSEG